METTCSTAKTAAQELQESTALGVKVSLVEALAVGFILIPALLFLVRWIAFPYGLGAAAVYVCGIAFCARRLKRTVGRTTTPRFLLAALLLALCWVLLSGISGHFYANAYDWTIRFALARDLAVFQPPVTYGAEPEVHLLRTAIAYFLAPSEVSRWAGLKWLPTIYFLWTAAGVALFFVVAFRDLPPGKAILCSALFIFCSGLDFAGWTLSAGHTPLLGTHLEWWTSRLQYSSNTTLLFWVPNHALAAWLATAMLFRFHACDWFPSVLPILVPGLMLWSPLSGLGFLLLWILVAPPISRGALAQLLVSALFALPAGAIILVYLAEGSGQIAGNTSILRPMSMALVKQIAFFITIEILAFLPLLLLAKRFRASLPALVILLLLPFFSFGPSNDLLLRGSIPALTFIWLAILTGLTHYPEKLTLSMRLITFVLPFAVGAMTPMSEIWRSLTSPPWSADLVRNLPEAFSKQDATHPAYPPHYFTKVESPALRLLLDHSE